MCIGAYAQRIGGLIVDERSRYRYHVALIAKGWSIKKAVTYCELAGVGVMPKEEKQL